MQLESEGCAQGVEAGDRVWAVVVHVQLGVRGGCYCVTLCTACVALFDIVCYCVFIGSLSKANKPKQFLKHVSTFFKF